MIIMNQCMCTFGGARANGVQAKSAARQRQCPSTGGTMRLDTSGGSDEIGGLVVVFLHGLTGTLAATLRAKDVLFE